MLDRIEALTAALEIVSEARAAVYGKSPAVWEFLWHVTRYLNEQQAEAFAATFRDAASPNSSIREQESLNSLADAVRPSGTTEKAEAQLDPAVRL